jgi:flavodoxin
MKILIVYHSLSGQTEKIASAIYDACKESEHNEAVLKKIEEIKPVELDNYDLVFFGSACHDSGLTKVANEFLENLSVNQNYMFAGFYTHSVQNPDSKGRHNELFERWAGKCEVHFSKAKENKNLNYIGTFHCEGMPTEPLKVFIHEQILPDEDEWQDYLDHLANNPPTVEDIQNAKKFAKDMVNLVS